MESSCESKDPAEASHTTYHPMYMYTPREDIQNTASYYKTGDYPSHVSYPLRQEIGILKYRSQHPLRNKPRNKSGTASHRLSNAKHCAFAIYGPCIVASQNRTPASLPKTWMLGINGPVSTPEHFRARVRRWRKHKQHGHTHFHIPSIQHHDIFVLRFPLPRVRRALLLLLLPAIDRILRCARWDTGIPEHEIDFLQ